MCIYIYVCVCVCVCVYNYRRNRFGLLGLISVVLTSGTQSINKTRRKRDKTQTAVKNLYGLLSHNYFYTFIHKSRLFTAILGYTYDTIEYKFHDQ